MSGKNVREEVMEKVIEMVMNQIKFIYFSNSPPDNFPDPFLDLFHDFS